jgi:AcrR family transcriptional regulator
MIGPMEKQERKEREFKTRRAEILSQAERAFSAKGFHNVTMAEIANGSGFSTGSLYQFFPGKEQLYAAMISEKLDLMFGMIREEVTTTHDITDKIAKLIEAHFHFVENNADFCRLILRAENVPISDIMTALRQKMIEDYFKHLTFIENLLKSGIKKGILRSTCTRDMAAALFGLIRSASIDWIFLPTNKSLCSKKDFILEIFLKGVKNNEH